MLGIPYILIWYKIIRPSCCAEICKTVPSTWIGARLWNKFWLKQVADLLVLTLVGLLIRVAKAEWGWEHLRRRSIWPEAASKAFRNSRRLHGCRAAKAHKTDRTKSYSPERDNQVSNHSHRFWSNHSILSRTISSRKKSSRRLQSLEVRTNIIIAGITYRRRAQLA